AAPNLGDNVSFTLTVSNTGPDAATNVVVTDQLPAGFTFVSSDGSYDATTGLWTVGSLANGASATLTIIATTTDSSAVTNTPSVTADQTELDSSDNTDSAMVDAQAIDLAISKAVDNASPNLGDNVTFTLTVSNTGPDAATNVVVTDQLPAGFTFVSSNGSYNATTGLWTVGSLASGASTTLTIVATTTDSSAVTNTASVTADQTELDSSDNIDSVSVDAQAIDLALSKTVDNASPNLGDNVTFTLTVSNTGPDTATNVVVTDQLPAGFTFVSSDGSYDASTGLWTVGSLASGESATLQIVVRTTDTSKVVNSASVTADQTDTDLTNNNGSVSVDADPAYHAAPSDTGGVAPASAAAESNGDAASGDGDGADFTESNDQAANADAGSQVSIESATPELVLQRDIPEQSFSSGQSISVVIPTDTFASTDPNVDIALTALMANGDEIPEWLSFDSNKGEFYGIPPAEFNGSLIIRVIARDAMGNQVETVITITVSNGMDVTAMTDQIPGQLKFSEQLQAHNHFAWKAKRDALVQLARSAKS
ncbi:putative Ig domain-containing protein, partial [Alteromonas lipolytica]